MIRAFKYSMRGYLTAGKGLRGFLTRTMLSARKSYSAGSSNLPPSSIRMSDTLSSGVEIDVLSQEVEESMFAAASPLNHVAELDEYDGPLESPSDSEVNVQQQASQTHFNQTNPQLMTDECAANESEGHPSPELQMHLEGTHVIHGPFPSTTPLGSEPEDPYLAASLRRLRQTPLERSYENEVYQQAVDTRRSAGETNEVELEEAIERRERTNSFDEPTSEEALGLGDEAECKRGIIHDSETYRHPSNVRLLIAPVDGDNSDSFAAAEYAASVSASIRRARDEIQQTANAFDEID